MSKTFKDFLEEDLGVFFNDMEFAEEHELEGETLLCIVIDSDTSDSSKGYTQIHEFASQEVYQDKKTVYVKKEDFFIPKIGAVLTLDESEFYVEETEDQKGILKIVLSANES